MVYDAKMRKEIKAEQKAIVKSHYGKVVGAQFLCMLPMMLIGIISMVWSFRNAAMVATASYQSELQAVSSAAGDMNTVVLLLQLLIGAPLSLGLMNFLIKLMRGEEPSVGIVIQPLTSLKTFLRSIRMSLVLYLRSLIWSIGPVILMVIALFMMVFANVLSGTENSDGFYISLIVWYTLLIVIIGVVSVKISMYNAGYVLLHDNEYIGTWDATCQGNTAFRGHFKDLLVFYLSFTPWYLLYSVLLIGAISPIVVTLVRIDMQGSQAGMAASVMGAGMLSLALILIVSILLGSFLSAYQTTSFLRLFERIAPAPEAPPKFADFQVAPSAQGIEQAGAQPPETPATPPEPREAPETPEDTPKD